MPWFCKNCGTIMHGTTCGGRWKEKGKTIRCNKKYPSAMSERIPPLDGMIFINDDGTGITRLDQMLYDYSRKRNTSPKVTKGPRPTGWDGAMERIGARAYAIIKEYKGCLPEC